MPLDPVVRARLDESFNYVERLAKDRSKEALEAWGPIRHNLLEAIRDSGDYAAIQAAQPAERLSDHETPKADDEADRA